MPLWKLFTLLETQILTSEMKITPPPAQSRKFLEIIQVLSTRKFVKRRENYHLR